jgi:hypothetical protein
MKSVISSGRLVRVGGCVPGLLSPNLEFAADASKYLTFSIPIYSDCKAQLPGGARDLSHDVFGQVRNI